MPDLGSLKDVDGKNWPVVTIQLTLLSVILAMIVKDKINGLILVSLMLILTIFVLQGIRRRFLMLYPLNGFVNADSSYVDTWALRILILLASLFLFQGVVISFITTVETINVWFTNNIILISVLVIGFFPIAFWLLEGVLRKKIAERLTFSPDNTYLKKCPNCYRLAVWRQKIVDENTGQITVNCECRKELLEYFVKLKVGS